MQEDAPANVLFQISSYLKFVVNLIKEKKVIYELRWWNANVETNISRGDYI